MIQCRNQNVSLVGEWKDVGQIQMKKVFLVKKFGKENAGDVGKSLTVAFRGGKDKVYFKNIDAKGFDFSFDDKTERVTISFTLRRDEKFVIGEENGIADQFEI